MNVTVCGPNLNDQSKGQFHIHAAGCADLTRHARREPEYENGWTIEATSVRSVVEDVYADFIFHNDQDPWTDFVSDLHFFPCCNDLPYEVEQEEEEDTPADDDEYSLDDAIDDAVDLLSALKPRNAAKREHLDRVINRLIEEIDY